MTSKTPSGDRWLILLFAVLIANNLLYVLLGFASIPAYYERVTTLTVEPYRFGSTDFASNDLFQQQAAKRGLSLSQYAVEQTLFSSAFVLLFAAVSALVIWRARKNWFAWYTVSFLAFIGEYAFQNQMYVARLLPPQVYDANAIFWPLILLYMFLFPNGKPSPRLALWVIAPLLSIHLLYQVAGALFEFFPSPERIATLEGVTPWIQLLVTAEALSILVSQIYRYRRGSSPLEKQQTKWFLLGLATFSLSFVTLLLPKDIVAYDSEIGLLWFAFVPLSVGIAVLRYRLWDIDLIIRRTLVYGALTTILVLVYLGSVIVFQQLLRALTGQASDLAIVGSTLMIAALFAPLRNRIQKWIDHRLYRRKYDAARVLSNFGATVRDEVDLARLKEELLTVVGETMQPASATLWLRQSESRLNRGES